jgi:hypothetical protein
LQIELTPPIKQKNVKGYIGLKGFSEYSAQIKKA